MDCPLGSKLEIEMINLDNPYEVERMANEQGIPKESIYESDIAFQSSLLENNPLKVNSYIRRGNDYYELKKYDAAINDFTKAIELNQNMPEAYHYLADCYINQGKNDKAIEFYSKAINFPDYKGRISLFQRRAIAKKNIKNFQAALEDINEAIKINPNSYSDFYKLRSEIYYLLNDIENANIDYEKYEAMRINSIKQMLSKISNREKTEILFNLFSSLNDDEQNELLASLLHEYQEQ